MIDLGGVWQVLVWGFVIGQILGWIFWIWGVWSGIGFRWFGEFLSR